MFLPPAALREGSSHWRGCSTRLKTTTRRRSSIRRSPDHHQPEQGRGLCKCKRVLDRFSKPQAARVYKGEQGDADDRKQLLRRQTDGVRAENDRLDDVVCPENCGTRMPVKFANATATAAIVPLWTIKNCDQPYRKPTGRPYASVIKTYGPPAFGIIAASSPKQRAPVTVIMPASSHASSSQPGAPRRRADSADTMNIPLPIIEPTTIVVASTKFRPHKFLGTIRCFLRHMVSPLELTNFRPDRLPVRSRYCFVRDVLVLCEQIRQHFRRRHVCRSYQRSSESFCHRP